MLHDTAINYFQMLEGYIKSLGKSKHEQFPALQIQLAEFLLCKEPLTLI